jgi:hypothetical protein
MFPIGSATSLEPAPGVDVDLAVLAAVAGVLVVTVLVASAGSAWFALVSNRVAAPPRRSVVAALTHRLGMPVAVAVGVRMALEPGRGRSAVPVRPALVGAVVGVLGVTAALTFRAGVVDAVENPARFGQTSHLTAWSGVNDKDWAPTAAVQQAWARDPDVVGVNDTLVGVATVGTTSVTVFSYAPVGDRPLPVVTLSGRMPSAPNEIALGPTAARDTGAKIGDVLALDARVPSPMRVTGIVFVPEDPHSGYAEGGWLTREGYQRLFPDDFFKFHETHLAVRPGADLDAVTERLDAAAVEVAGAPVMELGRLREPAEVTQIRNVRVLPVTLGAFLALLAVGATGHALATAVRRRRHDVAVLRALGITRVQARQVVLTQANTLALVGLAFGVPLGVALGRTAWRAVAVFTPLLYAPPLAVLAVAVVGPVALVVANLLAALPARHAARIRVGDVLRAE